MRKGSLGIICLIAAIPLHVAALAYADLTLLAVNGSVAILANIIISTTFLEEKFNVKKDLPGLILITIGCVIVIIIANKEKPLSDINAVMEKLICFQSICFFILSFIVIVAAHMLSKEPFAKLRDFEKDCE